MSASGKKVPEEGNIVMCFGCGEIQMFDKDLRIVAAPPEIVEEVLKDPKIQIAQAMIRFLRDTNPEMRAGRSGHA